MKQRLKSDPGNAGQSLTILQIRGMLERIQRCVQNDIELVEFSARVQDAVASLDEARAVALSVMREVDAERDVGYVALPTHTGSMKLC